MELVAGSVIFNPASAATLEVLCEYDQFCNAAGFPFLEEPLAGVNEDPRVCGETPFWLQYEIPMQLG